MWAKVVSFVQFVYGDLPQNMENNTYSRACKPDQIIVSAIIESFVKDYENWKIYTREFSHKSDYKYVLVQKNIDISRPASIYVQFEDCVWLRNEAKNVSIKLNGRPDNKYGGMWVDDIKLSNDQRDTIINAWLRTYSRLDKIRRDAEDALVVMQLNEKKWNLAERLLNMKRNEFGALVPIDKIEEARTVTADPFTPRVCDLSNWKGYNYYGDKIISVKFVNYLGRKPQVVITTKSRIDTISIYDWENLMRYTNA